MTALHGQVALITGAAGGIGRALARAFVDAGARVAIADVDEAGLTSVLGELGGAARAFAVDLADDAATAALPPQVVDAMGGLDVLVNNAGVRGIAPMLELSVADWRATLDLDLTAPFVLTRAALPLMIGTGRGKIVNIASMAGVGAFLDRAAYCTAKAGVIMLTKCTALEYAARGIWCNAVLPGVVETPMTSAYFADEAMAGSIRDHAPMGRWCRPEEIAQPVLYLAGPDSDYVNGTGLSVDGGWTAGYRAAQLSPSRR